MFRIIEEETRESVANPVVRCLEQGKSAGLTAHAVLIGRSTHFDTEADASAWAADTEAAVRSGTLGTHLQRSTTVGRLLEQYKLEQQEAPAH